MFHRHLCHLGPLKFVNSIRSSDQNIPQVDPKTQDKLAETNEKVDSLKSKEEQHPSEPLGGSDSVLYVGEKIKTEPNELNSEPIKTSKKRKRSVNSENENVSGQLVQASPPIPPGSPNNPSDLNVAIGTHEDLNNKDVAPKPSFPCTYEGCQRVYLCKASLNRHTRATHLKQPYACSYDGCTYKTTQSNNLHRHINGIHTKKIKYPCPHGCGYESYFQSSIITHTKRKHPQSPRPS